MGSSGRFLEARVEGTTQRHLAPRFEVLISKTAEHFVSSLNMPGVVRDDASVRAACHRVLGVGMANVQVYSHPARRCVVLSVCGLSHMMPRARVEPRSGYLT